MNNAESPFVMTLSLHVLEHLGVNLYSNVPAVISEVIANAWDADADRVEITIDHKNQRIVIIDNGIGMGLNDINSKFLKVGYRRREEPSGDKTPKGRIPMGRKGIGKLSLFSIAKKIEVYSMKDDEKHALLLDTEKIEKWIKEHGDNDPYHPEDLGDFEKFAFLAPNAPTITSGTRIVIHDLKKQINRMTAKSLRKRLARRFGIRCTESEIKIVLDNEPISMSDRDYFGKLEYIFLYGKDERISSALASQTNISHRKNQISCSDAAGLGTQDYPVHGWIGLVERAKDLAGDPELPKDEQDSLNKISVMARQKLALEDALGKMRFSSQFVHYAIGEVHADFLDIDNLEDIAISNRQGIKEHDPRAAALFEFLYGELKDLRDLRDSTMRKKAMAAAFEFIPALEGWINEMQPDTKDAAQKFFAKINRLVLDHEQKKFLFAHAVPAFINYQFRGKLSALGKVNEENLADFLSVAGDLDHMEAVHYHSITSERLETIAALENAVENNKLEEFIQKFLFKHLWLLDPSWERGTKVTEKFVIDPQEERGFIDIQYRRMSGAYVIVELKRPGVVIRDSLVLEAQVAKYKSAVEKHADTEMREKNRNHPAPVDVVCILGKEPRSWENQLTKGQDIRSLEAKRIRVMTYGELLANARKMYQEYLDSVSEADANVLDAVKKIMAAGMN